MEAGRVLQEIDAVGSVGDYAWGLAVAVKDDAWRRASKYGPQNTAFTYGDRSILWWSQSAGAWRAGS